MQLTMPFNSALWKQGLICITSSLFILIHFDLFQLVWEGKYFVGAWGETRGFDWNAQKPQRHISKISQISLQEARNIPIGGAEKRGPALNQSHEAWTKADIAH